MATDIVQTLFGITPEGYQRQQDALLDARALKFAELDPMAQATYGIYRGAGQLGGALGRALGGEDPELARISLRQQVARDIDYTNPESVQAGIQRLAPLDPQGAMMLNQEYRKALESGALVGQRQASAAASLAQANRERTQAIPAEILKAQEIARLKQQRNFLSMDTRDETGQRDQQLELLDAQIAALEQRKPIVVGNALVTEAGKVIYTGEPKGQTFGETAERISLADFDKPFSQLTPAQRTQVNAKVEAQATSRARAGATNITNVQEKAELGARGKMLVEDYGAISKQAGVAARSLPALEINLAVLDKGFDTGFGTEVKATGARVLAALGVKDAEKYATDAQTFLANASAAVLQRQLEQKGPQTEADAQRITQTGAQLGNTKEANRFLLNIAKAQLKRDISQRDFYAAWYKKNTTYDGAEDAWFAGAGGKSLFDSPELKKYAIGGAAAQIPTSAAPAAPTTTPGMPPGFRRVLKGQP